MRRNREGEKRYWFFLPSCARTSSKFYRFLLKNPTSATRNIECFHSRGQHLCKFIGTKESVCIRKEFNSHRTCLGLQLVAVSLFWDTNMAAVTSCENTLLGREHVEAEESGTCSME